MNTAIFHLFTAKIHIGTHLEKDNTFRPMPIRVITILLTIGFYLPYLSAQQTEIRDIYGGCSALNRYKLIQAGSSNGNQSQLLFDYDVHFYHLDLQVERDTTFLSGSVTIQARVESPVLDTFALELIDEMLVDSIRFNGTIHPFYRENDELFIPLSQGLAHPEAFTCQVYYRGTPPPGNFFNGVSIGYDSIYNQSVVWSLSEPFNARQWWPTKQVLGDKADSVWVFLTTSETNKAGSIGLLTQVVNLPNNKVRYEWKSRYPIAYYLISYAVADYQEYNIYGKPESMQGDSILIQNYIYDSPGCLEQYKEGIDRTAGLLAFFSDRYTLYPFHQEKYGHCLTELSGGMEHQTMTTIGSFGLGIVAHELAHMWFGDNVTCASWSDIWVNEGFATYSDYLAHENLDDPQWAPIWLKNAHNYIIAQPDGSVYVPPDEIYYGNESRIFSGRLSYYKGAYLLHMIRYTLDDDELFFDVMKAYQTAFADSVATAGDFVDVLQETAGTDFSAFFDQWYYGEGHPVLNIDWHWDGEVFELTSLQHGSAGEVTPFFHMKYPVLLYMNNGKDTTIEIQHTQPFASKTVHINTGVDSIRVDPHRWVLKEIASINNTAEHGTAQSLMVYPNPATNRLFIQTSGPPVSTGVVYDVSGKEMLTFAGHQPLLEIDVTGLLAGLYFLEMEWNGRKTLKKFIKH